jgi:glycosyltransferase involved in cell wall biosynthesis
MHAGLNDYYPRVLAEAMACGRPCLAFAEAIAPDVIPPGCGLRLDCDAFVAPVRALLDDPARCRAMSRQARVHAEAHLGLYSTRPALCVLLDRLGRPAVRD